MRKMAVSHPASLGNMIQELLPPREEECHPLIVWMSLVH